jgi:Terminase small subunit
MLSGPRRKFCEGIIAGNKGVAAYLAAYPRSSRRAGEVGASRLLRKAEIQTAIERMRTQADREAGSALMTLIKKRKRLARIVRARVAVEPPDSDLWQAVKTRDGVSEFRLPDKIEAIVLDSRLAGQGNEAEADDEISALLKRCTR